ncbi:hypothetical protein ONN26_25095, partial [Salmonella enterica subsp. enterica serovar Muenster]|nr:hypothetical protein [Salmonella enterica subsp. enterica serovar Muenster]
MRLEEGFLEAPAYYNYDIDQKQNKNTLISNNNSLVGRAMIKERKTELVEGFRHSVPYINTH